MKSSITLMCVLMGLVMLYELTRMELDRITGTLASGSQEFPFRSVGNDGVV